MLNPTFESLFIGRYLDPAKYPGAQSQYFSQEFIGRVSGAPNMAAKEANNMVAQDRARFGGFVDIETLLPVEVAPIWERSKAYLEQLGWGLPVFCKFRSGDATPDDFELFAIFPGLLGPDRNHAASPRLLPKRWENGAGLIANVGITSAFIARDLINAGFGLPGPAPNWLDAGTLEKLAKLTEAGAEEKLGLGEFIKRRLNA